MAIIDLLFLICLALAMQYRSSTACMVDKSVGTGETKASLQAIKSQRDAKSVKADPGLPESRSNPDGKPVTPHPLRNNHKL